MPAPDQARFILLVGVVAALTFVTSYGFLEGVLSIETAVANLTTLAAALLTVQGGGNPKPPKGKKPAGPKS